MTSIVQTLADKAHLTFSKCTCDKNFKRNLNELVKSVNDIKAADLNFNPDTLWNDNNAQKAAPLSDIPVFKHEKFSMDVFIIRDGARIPIHDHPDMHGIIKVLHGTIEITSYNPIVQKPDKNKAPNDIVTKMQNLKLESDNLIPVELYKSEKFTSKDKPVVLTPSLGNFHEIKAVNGIAAMFDILAPPYDDNRRCHLYNLLETEGTDSECKMWLVETSDPLDHWFQRFPYTGPKVSV